jgi:hypothetical protein
MAMEKIVIFFLVLVLKKGKLSHFTNNTEFVSQVSAVPLFCVKAEKRPKQYIKREKSTFAEEILKLLHAYGPIFPILWEKYIFFLKNVIR